MGIDDLKGKASDAAKGEKGEQASDAALEKGSDAASSATGGKHDDKLDKAQSAADKKIGDS
ncbi:Rv0909 family putative TA system antitoxin [Cellulomonas shaoxiangyii]|uniref:Antitoxin n=1 Tax=Cellulomonas shaoxiangyii TaxID=2566013 RepID=A0A4V1CMZ6_9CELL|nr:Rv0909 family putative TA system antitoxin [Cellulomonas shaoxiangyii]QCB94675.1 antitoxin [Cellulomonas shaoxiangyii]TGY84728.1 antitoxin [Cellulomonas shaoxiangyii]